MISCIGQFRPTITNMNQVHITLESFKLLQSFIDDAPNWSGSPMVDLNAAQRGNLTQLKKAGLLTTFRDEGIDWVVFTAGKFNIHVDRHIEFAYSVTKRSHDVEVKAL